MAFTCPNGHDGPFTYVEDGYTLWWSVDSVDEDDKVVRAWGHYEVSDDGDGEPYFICRAELPKQGGDRYTKTCEETFPIPEGYIMEFT